MSGPSKEKEYNIYVRLDEQTVHSYFNQHDPAPLYKRQLGHEFEQYIYNSLLTSSRDAVFKYQFICLDYADKRFIAPVTQAIRSHFNLKIYLKQEEFRKFKIRTFRLLVVSLIIVLSFQAVLSYIGGLMDERMSGALHNTLDVFSWVILWKPIDRLIFYWNPFKKDLHLLERLANAEVIILEKTKIIGKDNKKAS
ncbi:MAG TPA: hypothetical protein PK092_03645 [Chitinophagaceae bacterium]|nr:hypothetical protein [Chitinophagaceae bacterium]